jgi:hypothetical protein
MLPIFTASGGNSVIDRLRGAVAGLPINGLNPISLALMLPGVSQPANRDAFGNGVGFPVDGMRPRGNNFPIDGQSNNDLSITGQAFQPNQTIQGYYLEDAWRLRQSLTLTLGVRHQYFGTPLRTLRVEQSRRTTANTGWLSPTSMRFRG